MNSHYSCLHDHQLMFSFCYDRFSCPHHRAFIEENPYSVCGLPIHPSICTSEVAVIRHGSPSLCGSWEFMAKGLVWGWPVVACQELEAVSFFTFFLSPPHLRIPGFKIFYVAYLWIYFFLTSMLWWKHELGFGFFTLQVLSQIGFVMGAGEMAESTDCSCSLHWWLTTTFNSSPGVWCPLLVSLGTAPLWRTDIHMQTKHKKSRWRKILKIGCMR